MRATTVSASAANDQACGTRQGMRAERCASFRKRNQISKHDKIHGHLTRHHNQGPLFFETYISRSVSRSSLIPLAIRPAVPIEHGTMTMPSCRKSRWREG